MPISLGMASTSPLAVQAFERSVSATLAVLLALKRCPSQIRYAAGSSLARRSAMEVNSRVSADDIFDFQRREGKFFLLRISSVFFFFNLNFNKTFTPQNV